MKWSKMVQCNQHARDSSWQVWVFLVQEIHSQWRLIDIRSLTFPSGGETVGNEFKRLLHELEDKYQEWSLIQKRISQLVTHHFHCFLSQEFYHIKDVRGVKEKERI